MPSMLALLNPRKYIHVAGVPFLDLAPSLSTYWSMFRKFQCQLLIHIPHSLITYLTIHRTGISYYFLSTKDAIL